MERYARVELSKSVLLVPERILWKHLPVSEIEAGIARGRGYKRGQRVAEFEERQREKAFAFK